MGANVSVQEDNISELLGSKQQPLRTGPPVARQSATMLAPLSGSSWRRPTDSYSDFEIDYSKSLGEGGFAKVYLGRNRVNGKLFAAKVIDKLALKGSGDEELIPMIRKEALILASVSHPNIIKIYYTHETEDKIYIFMDYYPGGDLLSYLDLYQYLNECVAFIIMHQVFKAVHYLHSNGIVHRDIKPENFLFDYPNRMNVVLADFGFSTYTNKDELLKDFPGTLLYAAPELMKNIPYHGFPVDIWALGITLYLFVVGDHPYETERRAQLLPLIEHKELKYPARLSAECVDLIKRMLDKNPKTRITIHEVMKHPWVTKWYDLTRNTACADSPHKAGVKMNGTTELYSPTVANMKEESLSSIGTPMTSVTQAIGMGLGAMIMGAAALMGSPRPKTQDLTKSELNVSGKLDSKSVIRSGDVRSGDMKSELKVSKHSEIRTGKQSEVKFVEEKFVGGKLSEVKVVDEKFKGGKLSEVRVIDGKVSGDHVILGEMVSDGKITEKRSEIIPTRGNLGKESSSTLTVVGSPFNTPRTQSSSVFAKTGLTSKLDLASEGSMVKSALLEDASRSQRLGSQRSGFDMTNMYETPRASLSSLGSVSGSPRSQYLSQGTLSQGTLSQTALGQTTLAPTTLGSLLGSSNASQSGLLSQRSGLLGGSQVSQSDLLSQRSGLLGSRQSLGSLLESQRSQESGLLGRASSVLETPRSQSFLSQQSGLLGSPRSQGSLSQGLLSQQSGLLSQGTLGQGTLGQTTLGQTTLGQTTLGSMLPSTQQLSQQSGLLGTPRSQTSLLSQQSGLLGTPRSQSSLLSQQSGLLGTPRSQSSLLSQQSGLLGTPRSQTSLLSQQSGLLGTPRSQTSLLSQQSGLLGQTSLGQTSLGSMLPTQSLGQTLTQPLSQTSLSSLGQTLTQPLTQSLSQNSLGSLLPTQSLGQVLAPQSSMSSMLNSTSLGRSGSLSLLPTTTVNPFNAPSWS